MRASVGRSSNGTKGREIDDMSGWRDARKLDCLGDEKFVKVRKVAEKPWLHTSRFASSASGMRWPMPGLEIKAMWGRNSVVKFSLSINCLLLLL